MGDARRVTKCAGVSVCGCYTAVEIRIRVETNTHPYEGKYCLPGGSEICVAQYPQYIHYARRPHLFFLEGIKGTLRLIISIFATKLCDQRLCKCEKDCTVIFVRENYLYVGLKLMIADNDTKWGSLMLIEVKWIAFFGEEQSDMYHKIVTASREN